jgi:predicted membrane-bound spermidine synthase
MWLVIVMYIAHKIAPDPAFVEFWYISLAPLGYVALAILTAPVTVVIAAIALFRVRRGGHPTRLSSAIIALICWVAVVVAFGASAGFDSVATRQLLIEAILAVPPYALFVPLPTPLKGADVA